MSYDLVILKDNPLGYWSFNGTPNDLTSASNHSVMTTTSYIAPPIIANSGSSLRITSTGSTAIYNAAGRYEAFSKYFNGETFTISFWFSLNNQLTGSGKGSNPYISNQLNLLQIRSGTTTLGKVYYDYLSNTIRFNIVGSGNSDAYYAVKDMDKQYYVVATYSNGVTSIKVNGESGTSGNVSSTSDMFNYSKTTMTYIVDGTSLATTSGSPTNFLINSLAFFGYTLSDAQIRSHMIWAGNTGKPIYQGSLSSSMSMFTFAQDPLPFGFYESLSGQDFNSKGFTTNLGIGQRGLEPIKLEIPTFNKSNDSSASYVVSSSGINISGKGGVDFNNIGSYFNALSGTTFSASLTRSIGTASNEHIFSVSDTNGSYLFLEYDYITAGASGHYYLRLYNNQTGSTTTLIDQNAGASAFYTNVAVKVNDKGVSLYDSNSGLTTTLLSSSSPIYLPLNFNRTSTLTIGNSYHSPKYLKSKIKNFGITSLSFTDFSATNFDFSTASTFMMRFTNSTYPFMVTQHGTWEYDIPSSIMLNCYAIGTEFDWSSMDNCKVYLSMNSGSTFNAINRYETATSYSLSGASKNIKLKVEIDTDYQTDSSMQYQTFSNIKYVIFNSLDLYSDINFYQISPVTSSFSNYSLSFGTNNITSRPKNFGIKFTGDSTRLQGSASLIPPAGASYSAVEFWYRPDSIISSASNFILSNASAQSASPAIWLDSSAKLNASGGILYVNGASVGNATQTVIANELYHIALVHPVKTNAVLYLNGYNWSSTASASRATYGYLTLWNNQPSASDVFNKYSTFIGQSIVRITDNGSRKIASASSVDSASAYKIG